MSEADQRTFCPECEQQFDSEVETCPEHDLPLLEYEVVEEMDDTLIGTVLDDRFEIREPLSSGAMGQVYRGVQTGVNREVAIKVLHSEIAEQEVLIKRFLREAQTLSDFTHPNIVNFVDFGQDADQGALYLTMELLEGIDLTSLLQKGRVESTFAVEVAMQTCSALAEPHRAGVVHRDLKPGNLMLLALPDGRPQIKVVDFGIAKVLEGAQTRLTQTGNVCGTPHYMSPEQTAGDPIEPSTDIYALGTILYEMLTGSVMFGGTSLQIMYKQAHEEPERLDELPEGKIISAPLAGLVHRMLAKSPEDRPEDVLEVREELERIRNVQDMDAVRVDPEESGGEVFQPWLVSSVSSEPVRDEVAFAETSPGVGSTHETDNSKTPPDASKPQSETGEANEGKEHASEAEWEPEGNGHVPSRVPAEDKVNQEDTAGRKGHAEPGFGEVDHGRGSSDDEASHGETSNVEAEESSDGDSDVEIRAEAEADVASHNPPDWEGDAFGSVLQRHKGWFFVISTTLAGLALGAVAIWLDQSPSSRTSSPNGSGHVAPDLTSSTAGSPSRASGVSSPVEDEDGSGGSTRDATSDAGAVGATPPTESPPDGGVSDAELSRNDGRSRRENPPSELETEESTARSDESAEEESRRTPRAGREAGGGDPESTQETESATASPSTTRSGPSSSSEPSDDEASNEPSAASDNTTDRQYQKSMDWIMAE